MTKKTNNSLVPVVDEPGLPPVRVKLRRVNANLAKAYPPDGESKAWWKRLKKALGTTSSDFVNASLFQLQAAARLPGSGICEMALNAALAMIEAAAPKDEIEGALAVQMARTHSAAMAVLARLGPNSYRTQHGPSDARQSPNTHTRRQSRAWGKLA